VLDALEAVKAAGVGEREDFYWTLHAVFVKRTSIRVLFDQAFKIFFRRAAISTSCMAMMLPQAPEYAAAAAGRRNRASRRRCSPASTTSSSRRSARSSSTPPHGVRSRGAAGQGFRADVGRRDRASQGGDPKRMVLSLDEVRTRRLAPARRGHAVDMRRTLRASMKARRRADRPQIPRPEDQAAADRGAARYFRLDEGIHKAVPALPACGDRCPKARPYLPVRHPADQCHPRAAGRIPTRRWRLLGKRAGLVRRHPDRDLAACLQQAMGAARAGQGAIVLLITDGLERDADDSLQFEIDRLHRSCRRLIWLNPLLRFEGFEARARGIRTMLPNVDEFRPIHNLDSMADLVGSLSGQRGLHAGRPGDPKLWMQRVA
jgi:uncharacterized protein with von Willebrand factor type A (vWA) domain